MKFKIVDTEAAYRKLLDMSDAEQQSEVFQQELVEPFAGLARIMGGDPMTMFAQWNLKLDAFTPENRDSTRVRLEALMEANAFVRSVSALERGYAAFAQYHPRIRHDTITFGLYLCDLSALPQAGGYSGFGAIPGWIMTAIIWSLLRRYIFGDEIMGGDSIGAPLYSGYALGYKVVQAYLQKTGKTVAAATFTPAEKVIA